MSFDSHRSSILPATLLNYITGDSSKKKKRGLALKLPPLEELQMQGVRVNISATTTLRFLHGTEYAPHPMGLYKHRHHLVIDEEIMEDPISPANIQRWIAQLIAIEGAEVAWETNLR